MRRVQWALLSLVAASSAALFTPARADLVFRGDRRDDEAVLRAVYAALPARGKEIDVFISTVAASDWGRVDDTGEGDTVGLYDDRTRELFVKEGEEELPFTFAHEFGHHVFFASFTRTERRDWRRFWKNHRSEMPHGDARMDPDEGFAECYAAAYFKGDRGEHSSYLAADVQQQVRSYFTSEAHRGGNGSRPGA